MKVHFPEFEPAAFLKSGHAQTIGGSWFPGPRYPYLATDRKVRLEDGDCIVLHDDCPQDWQPGDRVVMLIHGLAGSHLSPYMQRIAAKLNQRGIRTFRMDLRGCGAGVGLARYPVHSGRSEDAAAALKAIARWCPDSPTTLIGFSLGGNITLKLVGETGDNPPGHLDAAIAVCPPIDLLKCVETIQLSPNYHYDRYFVRTLMRLHAQTILKCPDALTFKYERPPRRLIELDNLFTAPACGFADAMDYYEQCSACRFLHGIRVPTLIIAAADDPLIPASCFDEADMSSSVHVVVANGGGHLGFLGRLGVDPDRRWLDWRIIDWVMHHDAHGPSICAPRFKRHNSSPAREPLTVGN